MAMRVNKKLMIKYSLDLIPLAVIIYVYMVYRNKMNDIALDKQDDSLVHLMKLLFVHIIMSGVIVLSNFIMYLRVTTSGLNLAYRRNYAALESLLVLVHIILGLIIIIMSAVGFSNLNDEETDDSIKTMFGMIWGAVGLCVVLDVADLTI